MKILSGDFLLKLNFCFLLSFCLILYIAAQPYTTITPQHEVQVFPLNLPDDLVGMNSAAQTPDGFLWIGSTRGLILSDGHESILYTQDDPRFPLTLNQPDVFLGDLQQDSMGHVYAAVSASVKIIRFNPETRAIEAEWGFKESSRLQNIHYDVSPMGDVFVLRMEESSDTFSIWKMYPSKINQLLFKGTKTTYGMVSNYHWLHAMHWVQTNTGILRITEDGKHTTFYAYAKTSQTILYPPFTDDHYYFYEVDSHSILYWDVTSQQPKTYTTLPPQQKLNSGYFMVRREMIYIANGYNFFILDTLHHTLQDLSAETYEMKKQFYPGAISEDILGFHLIDHQLFLLGSKYLYLLKAKPPDATTFQNNIPYKRINISMRGLAEDEHQNVYASFYSGIVRKTANENEFKPWSPISDLNADLYSAYSLTYQKPFLYWHSLKINTETGKATQIIPNQINGHVAQLLSGDTLWMYTWYKRNLYAFDVRSGKLDSVSLQSTGGPGSDFPTIINKMLSNAQQDAIWLATCNDGIKLISRQGKILQSFTVDELGTNQQEGINDILVDGDYLWYGSFDGLGKLNTRTREYTLYKDPVITPAMKQRSRTVFTILPDEQKGFYLGSHQGLVYFDTTTLTFAHLPSDHPLAQPEFNRTSAFKDSRGRYYFGSTNGLFSFLPEDLTFQAVAESLNPIRLYGIAIFNGKEKRYRYLAPVIGQLDHLVLDPSETNIEFSLSSPCFDHEIYYSYRIKGIHDEWSEYVADPNILIYALLPGKYTLEVKASANASDINVTTFQLPILMTASWYQKTWIWVLISFALFAFVAGWIRYWYQQKWKRQKALESLRIKISADLHDDVGSILSGLAMQSQVMSYEMEEAKRKPMLELSDMSREAMERMRDTVWAIDARKDKYENLIDRMRDFAEKNLERKSITHEFIMTGLEGKKFISPEVRQNIYLIFKEAIVNILKHSNARHVKIQFDQHGEKFSLLIHDDGNHRENQNTDGQGISNMQLRARKIGGTLHILEDNGYSILLKG